MQDRFPKTQQAAMGFIGQIFGLEQKIIEALVYSARTQGLRAGVRPYTEPQPEANEEFCPIKRAVFIEYPEKTVEWAKFGENQTKFLDSFPQYES